jgi:hypothetical protein
MTAFDDATFLVRAELLSVFAHSALAKKTTRHRARRSPRPEKISSFSVRCMCSKETSSMARSNLGGRRSPPEKLEQPPRVAAHVAVHLFVAEPENIGVGAVGPEALNELEVEAALEPLLEEFVPALGRLDAATGFQIPQVTEHWSKRRRGDRG